MTSLYIHIPFCAQKCFYCSFVVSIGQSHRIDLYLDALQKEMQCYRAVPVETIYLGGGTPSQLSIKQLERLADLIKSNFDIRDLKEWTIEINPDDVSKNNVQSMLNLGINRFSLGIQTFSEKRLKDLGRNHSDTQAYSAYQRLRESRCPNISVDFMFGFPQQTLAQVEKDLEQIVALDSEHISLYCLNIEPHSRFFTQGIQLPADDEQICFYQTIRAFIEKHGWAQYEVSNFSKKGFQSLHNRNYWQGGNYIGLGIGAHSFMEGRRYANISKLTSYIQKMQAGECITASEEFLNHHERMTEVLLFSLRMNEGVSMKGLEQRFQTLFSDEQKKHISLFLNQGLLVEEKGCLKATDKGRLVLDEIAPYLLT